MANYRRGVYDFTVDSTFTPFTMQEMLVPFTAYKEEYDREEEAYTELSQKANDFEYLSRTLPEDSKARQVYEGYANDLKAQADDLTKNGLGMGNRRALLNMKRRYSGEIGRLVKADEALKQEQTLRRQMSAKDPSMLYAVDNLSIDSYLDNQTPNLYGISGNELYAKGAAAGQSASKRVISAGDGGKTLGGYYRDYVQKMGYNADTIAKFRQDAAAIPELQQAADDILKANGVTDNLSGESLARARQQVINGMIDGAVYSEVHNPTRDLGVMTAAESAADARARESLNIQRESMNRQAAAQGLTWNGKEFVYDVNKDPSLQKQIAILQKKKELGIGTGKGGSSGSGTNRYSQNKEIVKLEWETANRTDKANMSVSDIDALKEEGKATIKPYEELSDEQQLAVSEAIGDTDISLYSFWETPHDGPWYSGSTNKLYIVPRDVKVSSSKSSVEEDSSSSDYNE